MNTASGNQALERIREYLRSGAIAGKQPVAKFLEFVANVQADGVSEELAKHIRNSEEHEYEHMAFLAIRSLEARGDSDAITVLISQLGQDLPEDLNWDIVDALHTLASDESRKHIVTEQLLSAHTMSPQSSHALCWISYALIQMGVNCDEEVVVRGLAGVAGKFDYPARDTKWRALLCEAIGLDDDVWKATVDAFGSGEKYVSNDDFKLDYHPDSYAGDWVKDETPAEDAIKWLCSSNYEHVAHILRAVASIKKFPNRAKIAQEWLDCQQ